eukprot:2530032-Prymnesium_polylepis.1
MLRLHEHTFLPGASVARFKQEAESRHQVVMDLGCVDQLLALHLGQACEVVSLPTRRGKNVTSANQWR